MARHIISFINKWIHKGLSYLQKYLSGISFSLGRYERPKTPLIQRSKTMAVIIKTFYHSPHAWETRPLSMGSTTDETHAYPHAASNKWQQTTVFWRQHCSILFGTVQRSQAFTSWLRSGLASRAILFLCSSFTGIRGLKNFGGWGENALKGLTVKAWGFSGGQPEEYKKDTSLQMAEHRAWSQAHRKPGHNLVSAPSLRMYWEVIVSGVFQPHQGRHTMMSSQPNGTSWRK